MKEGRRKDEKVHRTDKRTEGGGKRKRKEGVIIKQMKANAPQKSLQPLLMSALVTMSEVEKFDRWS